MEQEQPSSEPVTPWRRGRLFGFGAFGIAAVVLIFGYWRVGDALSMTVFIPLFVAVSGSLCGLFATRGWSAWLSGTLFGFIVGAASTAQIYLGPQFDGAFNLGLINWVVFLALGFIFGGVAELIRGLHRLSHKVAQNLPPPAGPKK